LLAGHCDVFTHGVLHCRIGRFIRDFLPLSFRLQVAFTAMPGGWGLRPISAGKHIRKNSASAPVGVPNQNVFHEMY
jgi:hypothetical protein